MDNAQLAKYACEVLEKSAKNYYSDKSFKQQFSYTMSDEDKAKELAFLDSQDGQDYYAKQDKYQHIGESIINHALITAPATAIGIMAGMQRGNMYGKGLAGAALGGALVGIPTALGVQGVTSGLHRLGNKLTGTPYELRRKAIS